MSVTEAFTLVDRGSESLKADEAAAQTFTILNTPPDISNALHSVGFLVSRTRRRA